LYIKQFTTTLLLVLKTAKNLFIKQTIYNYFVVGFENRQKFIHQTIHKNIYSSWETKHNVCILFRPAFGCSDNHSIFWIHFKWP